MTSCIQCSTAQLYVYSQADPVIGTCSNTVMVMTKEEMKREIRAQVADALANSSVETTNTNILMEEKLSCHEHEV